MADSDLQGESVPITTELGENGKNGSEGLKQESQKNGLDGERGSLLAPQSKGEEPVKSPTEVNSLQEVDLSATGSGDRQPGVVTVAREHPHISGSEDEATTTHTDSGTVPNSVMQCDTTGEPPSMTPDDSIPPETSSTAVQSQSSPHSDANSPNRESLHSNPPQSVDNAPILTSEPSPSTSSRDKMNQTLEVSAEQTPQKATPPTSPSDSTSSTRGSSETTKLPASQSADAVRQEQSPEVGEVRDSDNIYSTMVSPQKSLSPLNTISLEEEMETVKQSEETKKTLRLELHHKEEYKSHLLQSAGVHLIGDSESEGAVEHLRESEEGGANVDPSGQGEHPAGAPLRGGSESSENREKLTEPEKEGDSNLDPSVGGRSVGKGSHVTTAEDRSLEQFSEILLDSDSLESLSGDDQTRISSPEDPEQSGGRQKVEKKVRFADEVEQISSLKKKNGASASGPYPRRVPPLSGVPSSLGRGDLPKHPGVPVATSPTSPKHTETQVPPPSHTAEELVAGVEYSAEYLGSTPIYLSGSGSNKGARIQQAQQAVKLIKDPDNDSQPRVSVRLKISTKTIKIASTQSNVDMMDHALHTISYVADVDNVLVIMVHRTLSPAPPTQASEGEELPSPIPKMICHVLETGDARHVALVIGQAFSVAYKEFLRANGISEESLEEAEYTHVLNAQSVPQAEVESLADRNKTKKLTLAKNKGEMMGLMVMESGYGSAIPTCVIAHMSKGGAAARSGLLNVGDHIISINGVSLVGMPIKACIEQIKKCRQQNVVKLVVCSCPTVVDVTIVRPDLKFQLGFSVQDGVVCTVWRGSIGERSGIRVGHRVIEINGTSTVGMEHDDIVHLLSTTVGDLHIRTMPFLIYKLITGQATPEYH